MATDVESKIVLNVEGKSNMSKLNKDMLNFSKQIQNMSKLMSKNMKDGFDKINKTMAQNNKISKEASKNTEKYRGTMMGLRRAMIAFFFVSRELGRLLSPAAQLVGIFDIFNTILTVTFLPIMLFILQYVMLPLMNFFLGLPEPIQFVIGALTVLATVLTTVGSILAIAGIASAAAFAPVALIIGSIILAAALIIHYWEPIKSFFSSLGGIITGIAITFGLIPAAVAAAVMLIITHINKIGDTIIAIKDGIISGFMMAFNGVKDSITSFINWFIDKANSAINVLNIAIRAYNSISMLKVPTVSNIPKLPTEAPGTPPYSGPSYVQLAQGNGQSQTTSSSSGQSPVVINQTNNYTVPDENKMVNLINSNNKNLVMDIKRMVATK